MSALDVINSLKSFTPPEGWGGHLFLLPEEAMVYIYEFIVANKLKSCVELGTGFGATSIVMATAVEVNGGNQVLTIDKYIHEPVNVKTLMSHVGLKESAINVVADSLGYNWYMADLIRAQSHEDICEPLFDFCLLDGAHEWEPDALAFTLVAKLLKPGGWIAIDDINFCLRMIPNWKETHGSHTDRELDTFQMGRVYDLIVKQRQDFTDFHITHNGRIGWARKKPVQTFSDALSKLPNLIKRFLRY